MTQHIHKHTLMAAFALAVLLFCPCLRATSTLEITSVYSWSYTDSWGETVVPGPYQATVDATRNLLIYCMDLHIATPLGQVFSGYLTHPQTANEEEAAFLAAYSLTLGAPDGSATAVQSYEGPISMAIWQLMGTLGTTKQDANAQPFVLMAQNAYTSGKITPAFLSTMYIWNPSTAGAEQRFLFSQTPEPGTMVFLGSGLVLVAFSRIRRRR